jgi:hypothetical protein
MLPYSEPEQIPNEIHFPQLLPLYGNIYFHGATKMSAEKIWESGLWLSNRKYPMIWMTSSFGIAVGDAQFPCEPIEYGHILVLELDDSVDELWSSLVFEKIAFKRQPC